MQFSSAQVARVFLVSMIAFVAGCDLHKTAKSPDNKLSVKLPIGWSETALPNSKAKITVTDSMTGGYVAVLTETKSDFHNLNLQKYAKLCMTNSEKHTEMTSRQTDGPTDMTINGKPAVRYHVTGVLKSTNLEYYFTFYETDTFYVQVMCWSTPSNFTSNTSDFEAITSAVVETKP